MNEIRYLGYSKKDLKIFHKSLQKATVSNEELHYNEFRNVTLQPFTKILRKPNSLQRFVGGLFSEDGKSIEESFILRDNRIIAGSNKIDSSITSRKYVDSDYIYVYIGCLENHYGHFLIEIVTKLFILDHLEDIEKVRFIVSGLYDLPVFIIDLFTLFGFKEDNFLIVNEQSFFNKVIIPHHSFLIKRFINVNLFTYLHKLITKNIDLIKKQETIPVFISRTKFSNLKSKVIGEIILEKILFKNGYKIYHPQDMNLIDQIKMVNNYKNYLGFSGSAFHNFIFSVKPVNLVQYCSFQYPRTNFVLSDMGNPSIENSYYINSSFPDNKFNDIEFNTYKRAQVINIPKILAELNKLNFSPNIKFSKSNIQNKIITEYKKYNEELSAFRKQKNMENKILSKWGDTIILRPNSFSKINYLKVLSKIHDCFNDDYIYFEIGTNKGNSMKLANGHSIGVDPNFIADQNIINKKKSLQLFQTPSNEFFVKYASEVFKKKKISVAFIDGLHHGDQVFMDFFNTEQHSNQNTVFLFHDILPRTLESALKERETKMWLGDVWKAIWFIYKNRRDLTFYFLDALPSGLLMVQYKSKVKNEPHTNIEDAIKEVENIKDKEIYEYLNAIKVVRAVDFVEYIDKNNKIPKLSDLVERNLSLIDRVSNL